MRLAISITFFYKQDRLRYLCQVCKSLTAISPEFDLWIVTNTSNTHELDLINAVICKDSIIVTPSHLGHPFLLTWVHRDIFRSLLPDSKYTHYLYLEDDILFTDLNLAYWLRAAKQLKHTNYIPGFMRYEIDRSGIKVASDIVNRESFTEAMLVQTPDQLFIGLKQCYQAMYLLSRRQAIELLTTGAGSPDTGFWCIREKAAQGLTFWKVASGSHSRMLLPLDKDLRVHAHALIHHLPNNYALDKYSQFGKIAVGDVLLIDGTPATSDISRPKQWDTSLLLRERFRSSLILTIVYHWLLSMRLQLTLKMKSLPKPPFLPWKSRH
jgi:hypothetical protein